MYLINITLKSELVPTEQAEQLFAEHSAWFAKHLQAGNFLLLGPYTDREHAGVIIAQAPNRAVLDEILAEDVYFPKGWADYEIREFKMAMVATPEKISEFVGK